MSTVAIETAQNVELHHEVAAVGDRLVAYLIDGLVKFSWVVVWYLLWLALDPVKDGEAFIIFWVIGLLPLSFYHLGCELLMDGKSIGKVAMRIKVARKDGGQPGLGAYLLRWLIRPLDGFYGIGLVVLLVNGKGQRIGDLAAGTTVVTLKQRVRLKDTLMTEAAPGHRVRFPEAIRLSDAQAALVKEVLNSPANGHKAQIVEELAAKVRKAIGNEGAGMPPIEFLQAVLHDHVHLAGQLGAGTGHFKGVRAEGRGAHAGSQGPGAMPAG
ncbi:MAG: RDD family protein [Flavobacteriales bacterium]